jgi:polysaccharide export outer membrane protein
MPSTRLLAEWRPVSRLPRALLGAGLSIAAGIMVAGCGVLPLHTAGAPPAPPVAAVAAHPVRPDIDSLTYANIAPASAPPLIATPVAAVAVLPATDLALGYLLDSGDKLRIVVFGQEGLSNTYAVDAAGNITMPLIGAVAARGIGTAELARSVAARLRNGFIREPHVAIEVETYRPFFILGEVTYPGQYAFVPNMTIETAVAIAGGFTPRAYRYDIKLDRNMGGGQIVRVKVPLITPVRPGDTITIEERWF